MAEQLKISYPADLPVTDRRKDLLAAIRGHQVVVVAGETGSGKSTQLPKMCLELGRGTNALIGHTQPRRLAARAVAERIADELETELGGVVGYAVRFNDQSGADTRLKLMTDGLLLAEIQRDRMLRRYDTIIVDEAHERSLNIDFLLGYLRQLLPKRPDLKVIITSATIDTERFAKHFTDADGNDAPIIEVSGRTYPVEYRWQELTEGRNQVDGICDAVQELTREGPGDILVFLAGEADIRDAEEGLKKLRMANTEIFPLFARLSAAEQHKVFSKHSGRRVVLATNVAETSLTVPGVRYVVDPGNARISRYSFRTKVQRLPIEAVSQASANQRAGRCGRIGPGVCIRLFSEEDYLGRPEFTEPEIQRTNLASVILQMASLDLGEIESFPFVDRPDDRSIRDGVALLVELGAVDPEHAGTRKWLTPMGRRLARLPVDPRLARMVIEADRQACLDEVLIIVAAMSVMDPRERPRQNRTAAEEAHASYMHDQSDFLTWLELWAVLEEEQRSRGSSQFRKWCKKNFLHYMRIREWRDVHRQLRRVARELKLTAGSPLAEPEQIHRALLAGLLSQIGMKDPIKEEYRGARGARFAIAPGSTMHKRNPDWVMAGELVETSRLWARSVTRIQPEWAEDVAEHLVERSHGDPWWALDRGSAYVDERVSLFGLPLITGRPVSLSQVNETQAREMFIHHALIEGEWDAHFPFMDHNAAVMADIASDQARQRRDVLVDYEALYAFYNERVGPKVVSGRSFENWWKTARKEDPAILNLDRGTIIDESAEEIDANAFPEVWNFDGLDLSLDYEFDPTSETDGVTVNVPVAALNQLEASAFDWNVPGLRGDLVTALIRALPKEWRKLFVPVPETVAEVLPLLDAGDGNLVDSLRRVLGEKSRRQLPLNLLSLDRIEDRLRPTFRVVDEQGRTLAESKDLDTLDGALETHVRSAIAAADRSLERSGMKTWECGELPAVVETEGGGHRVKAYPALVDEGDSVAVRLVATADEQQKASHKGIRRLLALALPSPSRVVKAAVTNDVALSMSLSPWPKHVDFVADCNLAALNLVIASGPGESDEVVRNAVAFDALLVHAKQTYTDSLAQVAEAGARLVLANARVERLLMASQAQVLRPSVLDAICHLERLMYPGCLTRSGFDRLADLDRYLGALEHRLQKLPERIAQDGRLMAQSQRAENEVYAVARQVPSSPALTDILWMLEEFRVSLFAQQIGTRYSISEKRIRAALRELVD